MSVAGGERPFKAGDGAGGGRRRRWAAAALLAFLAFLAWAGWQAITWPDVAALASANPSTTRFIERYRMRQAREAHPHAPEWTWVSYARVAPELKRAVLVSEDIGFFGHQGFDTAEMQKAFEEAWAEKRAPRGASTITQQVAKNLWLSPSRNPLRKLKEALLARELERHLTKRRILEIYLNVAEFGPGIFGAEAAARHYFGKSAAALGAREAAELASGLSRPSVWHPGATGRGFERQVGIVLGRMEKATFLEREI